MTKPPPLGAFQTLLATANLPPPGPEHFAARRALWTTPTAASHPDQTTHIKQDDLLSKSGVTESSEVSGTAHLPLCTVVCHALAFPFVSGHHH